MSTATVHSDVAATVYFDGACPLCRLEIDHYKSQRGAEHIAFIDASQEGNDLGAGLDRRTALSRFHVRNRDGALISGAAAFTVIWGLLPSWRWAATLARLPGMPIVLETAYRGFLRIRPAVSRAVGRFTR